MQRDVTLDVREGGGSSGEPVFGIVRVWGTAIRVGGPAYVLTSETTLKLVDGKATLSGVLTNGTGPLYTYAYIIQVEPFCGRAYRFMVGVPDGTTSINLIDLPRLIPNQRDGFYVDITEWEAIYGPLPSRVSALELSQGQQDTKISSLNGQGQRGYTFNQTAGRKVALWDYQNSREQLIYGDTGIRLINSNIPTLTSGNVRIFREGYTVTLLLANAVFGDLAGAGADVLTFPTGFSSAIDQVGRTSDDTSLRINATAGGTLRIYNLPAGKVLSGGITFRTNSQWPTTLPGTAVGTIPNL